MFEETPDSLALTIFNNYGKEGPDKGLPTSGLVLDVNIKTMTVTNRRTLLDPKQTLNSDTQGSLQALGGNTAGNMLVGYGSWAAVKEFNAKDELIWTARFGPDAQIASYRSFKFEWHAIPSYPPSMKAVAYRSPAMQRSTHIYVSWNGATDLARWNFFAQDSPNAEPILIGSIPKTDFETSLIIEGYLDRVSVEPVLLNGTALPRSPVQRTDLHGDWRDANGTLPVVDSPSDVVPLIVDPEPVSKLQDEEEKVVKSHEDNALENDYNDITVEVDYDTDGDYEAPLWIEAALFFFVVCLIGGTVFLFNYLSNRRKEAWYN